VATQLAARTVTPYAGDLLLLLARAGSATYRCPDDQAVPGIDRCQVKGSTV